MNRESVSLQPAFILHQRPYRDSSRLVDCVSRDYGRVALVARGVRRPRSKLRSVLMPFQSVLLSWVRRGDLGTLTGAELDGRSIELGGTALMSAYYLNELLLRLVQSGDSQPEIFTLYAHTLAALSESEHAEAALRLFEKRLLECLGYGLALDKEWDGGNAVVGERRYRYRAQAGPVQLDSTDTSSDVISGAVLLAIAREEFTDAEVLRTARRILHEALHSHLGERPLRVRTVARAMARAGSATPRRQGPTT